MRDRITLHLSALKSPVEIRTHLSIVDTLSRAKLDLALGILFFTDHCCHDVNICLLLFQILQCLGVRRRLHLDDLYALLRHLYLPRDVSVREDRSEMDTNRGRCRVLTRRVD